MVENTSNILNEKESNLIDNMIRKYPREKIKNNNYG